MPGMLDIQSLFPQEAQLSARAQMRQAQNNAVAQSAALGGGFNPAGLLQGQAAQFAQRLPGAAAQMARGLGRNGRNFLTPEQNLNKSLADYSRTQDEEALEQNLSRYNPSALPGFRNAQEQRRLQQRAEGFQDEKARQEALTAGTMAELRRAQADLARAQTEAQQMNTILAPREIEARLRNSYASMKSAEAQFLRARLEGANTPSQAQALITDIMDQIGTDNHDSSSVSRFLKEARKAATVNDTEGILKAYEEILLQKAGEGRKYVPAKDGQLDEYGRPKYIQYPIEGSEAWTDTVKEIRQAEQGGELQKRHAGTLLKFVDEALMFMDNPNVSTGLMGEVGMRVLRGDTYQASKSLEEVGDVIGLLGLQEAKSSSENGASGFGQLTEMELQLLRNFYGRLEMGMSKEELRSNLNYIKEVFTDVQNRAKTSWTMDEWLGVDAPPVQPEATIQDLARQEMQRRGL